MKGIKIAATIWLSLMCLFIIGCILVVFIGSLADYFQHGDMHALWFAIIIAVLCLSVIAHIIVVQD